MEPTIHHFNHPPPVLVETANRATPTQDSSRATLSQVTATEIAAVDQSAVTICDLFNHCSGSCAIGLI